jgi:hypothetical protein
MLIAFDDFNSLVTSILWNLRTEDRIVVVVPAKMNTDHLVASVVKDGPKMFDDGMVAVAHRDDNIKVINKNIFIVPLLGDGSKIRGLRAKSTWVYNRDHMKQEDWAAAVWGFSAVSKDPISKVKRRTRSGHTSKTEDRRTGSKD